MCGLLIAASLVGVSGCDSNGNTGTSASVASVSTGSGAGTTSAVMRYRSRPDLQPPAVQVARHARRTASGYVLVAPKGGSGQAGPMIIDNRGQLVWFQPLRNMIAMDFRVQRYKDKPVLTWWQGTPVKGWGRGELVIADTSFTPIAHVRASGQWKADHHDSLLTPEGTALIFVYRPVRMSTKSIGGPSNATVMDCVIQEIDVETGRLVWQWNSLSKVGLHETYRPAPRSTSQPLDYFHINSIQIADDGNLIVGARNTHAVYKVNRKTGAVMWRLGGRRSNFKMGRNTRFAWQHDSHFAPGGNLTIFDNAADPQTRPQSRAIELAVNTKRRRVTLKRQYQHPRRLVARSQANMQTLPNSNVFIGWGSAPYLSEFSHRGRLLFDMRHLGGTNSYRAYRFLWTGRPNDKPAVALQGGATTTVYASWNGATEVAKWRVLAGVTADALRPIGEGRRQGFETALRVRTSDPYVAVEAIDRAGTVLGTSSPARR